MKNLDAKQIKLLKEIIDKLNALEQGNDVSKLEKSKVKKIGALKDARRNFTRIKS